MEAYSSSSSSTYLPQNPQVKNPKQHHPFQTSLHSVRKLPAKPWKKPVAPLPPTPPRIYKVEPRNFREVVQKLTGAPEKLTGAPVKLTGAPEFQCHRLQSVAPPPLSLDRPPLSGSDISTPLQFLSSPEKTPLTAVYQKMMSEMLDPKPHMASDGIATSDFLGLSLSPSTYTWCSFALLSPGTLSSLEENTVL